jgi:hypothetical protein
MPCSRRTRDGAGGSPISAGVVMDGPDPTSGGGGCLTDTVNVMHVLLH